LPMASPSVRQGEALPEVFGESAPRRRLV
jgi:hypothetical protein